jgi:hypothetical protein
MLIEIDVIDDPAHIRLVDIHHHSDAHA